MIPVTIAPVCSVLHCFFQTCRLSGQRALKFSVPHGTASPVNTGSLCRSAKQFLYLQRLGRSPRHSKIKAISRGLSQRCKCASAWLCISHFRHRCSHIQAHVHASTFAGFCTPRQNAEDCQLHRQIIISSGTLTQRLLDIATLRHPEAAIKSKRPSIPKPFLACVCYRTRPMSYAKLELNIKMAVISDPSYADFQVCPTALFMTTA